VRLKPVEELLETVHAKDPEVEAAWDVEIKRRITEIENGTAKLTPSEEVFAEIRRMIKSSQRGSTTRPRPK
jgi:Putative addiction module component